MDTPRAPRPDSAPPIGHFAATHLTGPTAPVPPLCSVETIRDLGSLAPLDEVLRGLSWRCPNSRERAVEAVDKLRRTRAQLLAAARDPAVSDPDLLRGLEQLGVRCDWMLGHWTGDHLTAEGWSGDHTHGLIQDLQLLAQAGAPLRNRIEQLAAIANRVPEQVAASYAPFAGSLPGARHRRPPAPSRRTAEAEPTQDPGSAAAVLARMLYRRRIIGFSLVAGSAALAVGALFHLIVPRPATAPRAHVAGTGSPDRATQAQRKPSPAPAPRSASNPDAAVPSGSAARVTDLQVLLLGGSTAEQQVVAEIVLETSNTRPVTLAVSYWGQAGAVRLGQSWYSTTLSGAENYEVPFGIPSRPYCGLVVEVAASAGGRSETRTTSPGC